MQVNAMGAIQIIIYWKTCGNSNLQKFRSDNVRISKMYNFMISVTPCLF